MRYGKPSIDSAVEKLRADGFKKIIYIPLFPQYSTTTTLSIYKKICEFEKMISEFKFVSEFHTHNPVSYTHLRANETGRKVVLRLLL